MGASLVESDWKKVFGGEKKYTFKNCSFSMLIGRLSRNFRKDPSTLAASIQEANTFCEKYAGILQEDLATIKRG